MNFRSIVFSACCVAYFMSFSQNIVAPFSLSDQFHFYNGSAHETNWTRGVISNNLNWNNTTKRWERTTTHLDFSMIRFGNGKLSFVQGVDWSGNLTSFTTQEIEEDWTRLTIAHNGFIGIGTTDPKEDMHLFGKDLLFELGTNLQNSINRNKLLFHSSGIVGETEHGFKFSWRNDDMSLRYAVMEFAADGNVYFPGNIHIGARSSNNSHDGYRFSVNGKIRAHEVKVYTGWADYVFADNYELLTLEETEAYINENKHLPGIPSAEEVEANEGVNVGEMQKLQMAKIEELTLYMIAMKKELEKLKEENEQLKAAIIK